MMLILFIHIRLAKIKGKLSQNVVTKSRDDAAGKIMTTNLAGKLTKPQYNMSVPTESRTRSNKSCNETALYK